MALAPKFAGQKLSALSSPQSPHTLELYLDYVCPFSAKLFKTVYTTVYPLIQDKYADKVQLIFRQQVQPWHPSSTLVHEAAVAVLRLAPDKFWPFSAALFADQQRYFDVSVVGETRNDTYRRLARLGASVGVDADDMYGLLAVSDKPGPDGALNVGNGVTDDLKVLIKTARLVGVHVSPTAVFDGVVNNDISSGWGKKEWEGWLEKNVA
ncbi:MAG: hypothetical protein M1818_001920 [Claussenomyces sp. TS43310]|nr:MAG: hypothetical protein M1818_001920 [Claussenomyces sp. TS43310]